MPHVFRRSHEFLPTSYVGAYRDKLLPHRRNSKRWKLTFKVRRYRSSQSAASAIHFTRQPCADRKSIRTLHSVGGKVALADDDLSNDRELLIFTWCGTQFVVPQGGRRLDLPWRHSIPGLAFSPASLTPLVATDSRSFPNVCSSILRSKRSFTGRPRFFWQPRS